MKGLWLAVRSVSEDLIVHHADVARYQEQKTSKALSIIVFAMLHVPASIWLTSIDHELALNSSFYTEPTQELSNASSALYSARRNKASALFSFFTLLLIPLNLTDD